MVIFISRVTVIWRKHARKADISGFSRSSRHKVVHIDTHSADGLSPCVHVEFKSITVDIDPCCVPLIVQIDSSLLRHALAYAQLDQHSHRHMLVLLLCVKTLFYTFAVSCVASSPTETNSCVSSSTVTGEHSSYAAAGGRGKNNM